ncbi:hypothetical protein ASD79_03710 [Caulobacter sp. Root655]|uniref:hypothetical protein n=1 Tax=Caulobacter sp. Root655 TaxID=1736578 RepID=UPI0006FC5212|nr:hypothetical protein [Caulobacter sp. Root655]KRA66388.1 hypothetical protein ASD79_03710 [Caulobacter sp. Root655]
MNRTLKTNIGRVAAGLAALAMVAGSTAASAQSYRHGGGYYGGRHHHGGRGDAALAAGVIGLALGAAIASGSNDRHYRRGYDYGYAPPPPPPRYYGGYGYGPRYGYGYGRVRDCWTTRDYDEWSGSVYERTVCR